MIYHINKNNFKRLLIMNDSEEVYEFVKPQTPIKDAIIKSLPALGMLVAGTIIKSLSGKK